MWVEDSEMGYGPNPLRIDGYSDDVVGYHSYLLVDAGYAKGNIVSVVGSSSPEGHIFYLTWEGHEFADAAREEKRWKKAMGMVKEKGGSVSMEVLTQLLTSLAKIAIGLS